MTPAQPAMLNPAGLTGADMLTAATNRVAAAVLGLLGPVTDSRAGLVGQSFALGVVWSKSKHGGLYRGSKRGYLGPLPSCTLLQKLFDPTQTLIVTGPVTQDAIGPEVQQIVVAEDAYLTIRAPMIATDPLFSDAPFWGVRFRMDLCALVNDLDALTAKIAPDMPLLWASDMAGQRAGVDRPLAVTLNETGFALWQRRTDPNPMRSDLVQDADGNWWDERLGFEANMEPIAEQLRLGGALPDGHAIRRNADGLWSYLRTENGTEIPHKQFPFRILPAAVQEAETPAPGWPVDTGAPEMQLIVVTGQSQAGGVRGPASAEQTPALRGGGYMLRGLGHFSLYPRHKVSGEPIGIAPLWYGGPRAKGPFAHPALFLVDSLPQARAQAGVVAPSPMPFGLGYNGASLRHLSPDSPDAAPTFWDGFATVLGQAAGHATANGYRLRTPWHVLMQGTAHRHVAAGEYRPGLEQYLAIVSEEYARHGLDQPRFVLVQEGGFTDWRGKPWGVALDQLEYCVQGYALLATSYYPFQYGDWVHPRWNMVYLLGETLARAIAETEGGHGWTPLNIVRHWREGDSVFAQFDLRPDEALECHDPAKYVGGCTHMGFELLDADGAQVPIRQAAIMARDTVRLDAEIPAVTLQYAFQSQNASHYEDGYSAHRGLLRTNLSWPSRYFSDQRVYRWVPSTRIALDH